MVGVCPPSPRSNPLGFYEVVLHPGRCQPGFTSEEKPRGAASWGKGAGWQRLPWGWSTAPALAEKGQRCFCSRWPQQVPHRGWTHSPIGAGAATSILPRTARLRCHLPQERGERLCTKIEPVFLKQLCLKSSAQTSEPWGDAVGFAGREEEEEEAAGSHGWPSLQQHQADPCQKDTVSSTQPPLKGQRGETVSLA